MSENRQPTPFASDDPLSPRAIVSLLQRRRADILIFFLIIVGAVMVVALLTPNVYRSEAKLLNRVGRESLMMDPSVMGPTLAVSQSRESEINTELVILQSRYLLEKVVDFVGPERLLHASDAREVKTVQASVLDKAVEEGSLMTPREKAIEKLSKSLSMQVQNKSNIIDVSLDAYSPMVAREALEELLKLYQERHIELYGTQAPPKFFEEQANQLKATLESKENALRQFKLDHGIVELDKQKNALLDQISSLETSISDASSQASAAQARIDSLNETLRRTPGKVQLTHVAGKTNYAADSFKGRLAELRQEETQMASRYPDDYRPLEEVRKQIKVIEASLAREHETQTEVTTGVDVNYQNLQMNLEMEKATMKAQAARQESLKGEAVRLNGKLSALGAQEINLARLERETNALENEYTHSRENLQRALASSAMDADKISNMHVVQPATLAVKHVKPRRALMMALAMFFGLAGGIAYAFLYESWASAGVPVKMKEPAKGDEAIEGSVRIPARA